MPLRLEQYATGIYRIRGSHHGRRVDISAQTRIRADAEKVREATERRIFDEVVLGKKPERIFAEAATGYMRGGGERTYLEPIIERIGGLKLSDVTQDVIDDLALKLRPDAKLSTRNRHIYTPVSAVIQWAVHAWSLPPRTIRRPQNPPGRVDWRTPQEMEAWIEKAGHIAPLLTAYTGTGMRASELLHLEWKNVSPSGARVILWEEETKSRQARHIELPSRVRACLPERGKGPVWFNSWGQPWSEYRSVNSALVRIERRHGLPHLSLHVLRHTWATWAYAVTKDLSFVMARGGWKTAALAMRYVHAGTDDVARAVIAHGWDLRPGSGGVPKAPEN